MRASCSGGIGRVPSSRSSRGWRPHARRGGKVEACLESLPAPLHPPPEARRIHQHLPEDAVAGALVWSGDEADHGQRKTWRGPKRARLPESTSTSRDSRSGWVIAKRAAIEPLARSAHQHQRRLAGALDQSTEPPQHQRRVRRVVRYLRCAQARQVGCDHLVAVGQLRDHRQPHPRPAALAVQQHHRRPSPASSTAVDTPARSRRRSLTGAPASSQRPSVVSGRAMAVVPEGTAAQSAARSSSGSLVRLRL